MIPAGVVFWQTGFSSEWAECLCLNADTTALVRVIVNQHRGVNVFTDEPADGVSYVALRCRHDFNDLRACRAG